MAHQIFDLLTDLIILNFFLNLIHVQDRLLRNFLNDTILIFLQSKNHSWCAKRHSPSINPNRRNSALLDPVFVSPANRPE